MKKVITVLVLILLGYSGYSYYKIQALEANIAQLQTKLDEEQQAKIKTETALSEANKALAQAREAMQNPNNAHARELFDEAKQKVDSAAKVVSQKSGPALDWVKQQAGELTRKAQEKIGK